MNKQITFFGGSILPFVHAHYLERTYFEPFFKLVLICASFIFFLEGKGNLPPPFLPLFGKRSTIYLSNVFRTPHSNCTYVFINIYFCWDIFFFSSFKFFLLKRHYIRFFENAIFYSCMWCTSVNMFSENWRCLRHIDKNGGFLRGRVV